MYYYQSAIFRHPALLCFQHLHKCNRSLTCSYYIYVICRKQPKCPVSCRSCHVVHHGDIKSHQYIISFDPRDAADNSLTMEKAQALGLKFCEENFPGHPAIVFTHPDGHNHSGNIHVHIVIGSVRTREVERKPYMQKPRDWREGMKHSSTAQTMRHLRVEVMELCEGAGLYQIDLLNGSKERVSEAEYWARRRGLKIDNFFVFVMPDIFHSYK